MIAARVLSPPPAPSDIPVAIAMTFLSAPPASTPTTSWFTYTRNLAVSKSVCRSRAVSMSANASTLAEAMPAATSRGEVRSAERTDGVPGDLVGDHFGHPQVRAGLEALDEAHDRHAGLDVLAEITQHAADPARRNRDDHAVDAGHGIGHVGRRSEPGRQVASGRYVVFVCAELISSATSDSSGRTQSAVGLLRAQTEAKPVPHEPAPMTATLRLMEPPP